MKSASRIARAELSDQVSSCKLVTGHVSGGVVTTVRPGRCHSTPTANSSGDSAADRRARLCDAGRSVGPAGGAGVSEQGEITEDEVRRRAAVAGIELDEELIGETILGMQVALEPLWALDLRGIRLVEPAVTFAPRQEA